MTNETNERIRSTNMPISEDFKAKTLTANTNYGTINSSDIENGTAELVLMQPFAGDDGGISVACVGGGDSGSGSNSGNNNGSDSEISSDSCSDCEECY